MTQMFARPLVLIVDDQPDILRLLAKILRLQGYETAQAATADDALAQMGAHPPDIAVLDLGLSDRDGLCVLRELHALDPELPVIILTGNGSPDRAQEAMRIGAFDFFTKPFDHPLLLASLAAALASRQRSRDGLEVSRA